MTALDAIAVRRFVTADQTAFACLSGDTNPMHMDALAARRTQAGEPVVHGIHALLWALEEAAKAGLPVAGAQQIRAQFTSFIPLGRSAVARVARQDAARLQIALFADDVPAATVLLRLGSRQPAPAGVGPAVTPASPAPAVPQIDRMAACKGWLLPPVADAALAAAFPAAAAALSPRRLSALAQTSRLVGMVCPGLHSIFAGLTVDLVEDGAADGIGYRVIKADERFRLVDLAVWGGGLAGKVSAFARHPPIGAPAMAEIARHVKAGEFAGVTALVAGGSRGLGAVTAKIIAAGGGEVAITYAAGKDDAEAVRADIAGAGGMCRVLAYDATQAAAPQLAAVAAWATELYYFATAPIFTAQATLFSAARLAKFVSFYVEGFHDCYRAMTHPGLAVFYPSSVAVAERPAAMLEYAMAKAAGEMLCAAMQAHAGQRILVNRLPRVLTDQTATVARAESADAIQTLLPLVRAMRALGQSSTNPRCG